MSLLFCWRQYRVFFLVALATIAFSLSLFLSPMATAKLFDGPVDRLPLEERVALRQGQVILLGESGTYTGRVLAMTSLDTAWKVLTDYNNFAEFLPGVNTSKLLEANGDRKVFEQINQVKTFIFSTKARIRMAITESYPEKIAFTAIDGDLETLDGFWLLEPVSPYPSAPSDRVLITHQVNVKAAAAPTDGIFYNIYENSLEKTLAAIKQEAEKRSTQANAIVTTD
ncbi:MAG: SRPBCC family protein [Pleurocapsa sp.]